MPENIMASRLQEAREWIGFTREDAAAALGCSAAVLADLEAGGCRITGEQLRRLSRLYRRPVAWFRGESRFEPSADLLHMTEDMHPGDREVVLEFAEWLQGAGAPAKIPAAASEE